MAPMLTGARGADGQQFTLMALDTGGTGTVEAYSITGAGATSLAGLGFTGISSEALAAPGATPARLTHTAEASRCIMADTVTARLLGTWMAPGEAEWGQRARRAEAVKAVFPIHTGAALPTRAGCTLVDLHIAKGPCEARLADTVIAVDAIPANPKGAGVAGAVIDVDLAIHTCRARRAAAKVFVHQVQTFAPMATGLAAALVHLSLTARARVSRSTGTGEAGDAVHAAPMVARVRGAVVHVALTQRALKALCAAALVAVGLVHALGSIPAGGARALIHVQLTHGPAET